MLIKSKIIELDEWLFIEEIPDQYLPDKPLVQQRESIVRSTIVMNNFQLSTSGLFILYTIMQADQPTHIYTIIERQAITSQIIFFTTPNSKLPNGMIRHNI